MNSAQAKKIRLYDLLAHLGHLPTETRKGGNEAWYKSPFRTESDASFKIKLDDNIWYDFGAGEGGNILDFLMKFKKCDLRTALSFLENTSFKRSNNISFKLPANDEQTLNLFAGNDSKAVLIDVKPVYHFALKEYLKDRCIALKIAFKHLQEINYKVDDKEYFALGFLNKSGGWELRSSVFKGCIGKKDISVIGEGSKSVSVFEGYMDFLSCLTLSGQDKIGNDVIVMNSISLKKHAVEFIRSKGYKEVYTYFDNDKGGEGALETFREELPDVSIVPCNHLYEPFNDFNDYLKDKTMGDNIRERFAQ